MMSEQQFDLKLKDIEEQYAQRREDAEAFRDQEVSRLFVDCGWTQDKIGQRMGWTQGRVAQRLLLGRFLNYYRGNNSSSPPQWVELRFSTGLFVPALKPLLLPGRKSVGRRLSFQRLILFVVIYCAVVILRFPISETSPMSNHNGQLSLFSSEEHPARHFPSMGNEKGWMMIGAMSLANISDWSIFFALAGSSGKTSLASSVLTEEGFSVPSLGGWRNAGMGSPGECWTFLASEYPSSVVECSLSDVLKDNGNVPEQLFLTPEEVANMLARCRKYTGKVPEILEEAASQVPGLAIPRQNVVHDMP